MHTPARAPHVVLRGIRGAFLFRRRRGQALRSRVLPAAGGLRQSSSKMAALLAVNSGERARPWGDPQRPTGQGGAGLEGASARGGSSECGRRSVRDVCSLSVLACSSAPPSLNGARRGCRFAREEMGVGSGGGEPGVRP